MRALLAYPLYAAVGCAAAGIAAWLGRPIPRRLLVAGLVLPLVFLFPAFGGRRTIFPVDHAMNLPPWSALPHAPPANPNLNDVATEMAPWAKAVRLAWKEGSVPWRNRWNGCGSPLAANGQSAPFSPLTILMGALPLAGAFDFAAAVKLFLALSGTWLWLSALGVRAGPAAFGSVTFAFSFAVVPWLLFPMSAVVSLWPWALFAIERLRDAAVRPRATAALAAILAFELVNGHPESVVLGALFAAIWLGARAAVRALAEPAPVLGRTALAGAVAAGLTAFLLVPQLLAIRDSNRAAYALEFSRRLPVRVLPHGPAWPAGVFTTLLPRSLGDAMTAPMLPLAAGSFPEMALGHFGVVGWAGALLFLRRRRGAKRDRTEVALLVPLAAGFATAILLWPVFDLLYSLPVVKLMLPLRFFTWVALAGSAVAAFEVDRLARDLEAGRASGLALSISAAVILVVAAAISVRLRPLWIAAGSVRSEDRGLLGAVGFLVVVAALGVALRVVRDGRLAAVSAVSVLLLLAAGELFWQGRRLYRAGPVAGLYPPTPLVDFLRRQPGPFRVLGEGAVFYPGSNVFAGLEDVRVHDPVERREYVEWLDASCGYDPKAYFKHVRDVNCAALDRLNVKYLVTGPNRAAPGSRWRPVYDGDDGLVFENRDVRPRVFARDGGGVAAVTEYRETVNEVSFRVEVPGEGAVLATSLVDDGGWSARDGEGRRLRTGRAGDPFLTVAVPDGSRVVRLKYRPPGLPTGAAISLLTAVAVASGAVLGRRRPGAKRAVPRL